jgi:hypothetical protein
MDDLYKSIPAMPGGKKALTPAAFPDFAQLCPA